MTLTANNIFQLQGQNPYLATLGEMGDISNLFQFGWYEWVYFCQKKSAFHFQKDKLGRCIGPTKNYGNDMYQWVLHKNGQVVPRGTLRGLSSEELTVTNETESNKRAYFDADIKESLGYSIAPETLKPERESFDPTDNFDYDGDYEHTFTNIVPEVDVIDKNGKTIDKQSLDDLVRNAEDLLPNEEMQHRAKVIQFTIDSNGNIIGTFDENTVLNSLVYDVEFPDGAVKHYAANGISENVLSQVDSCGFYTQALDNIVLHRKLGNAVSMKDDYVTTKREFRKLRQTTIGWEFLIEWKDGSSSWMSLKVLKESITIEVADYATSLGLENKPSFSWWVQYTINKRYQIIYLVNS